LIGAIYLDQGIPAVYVFIAPMLEQAADQILSEIRTETQRVSCKSGLRAAALGLLNIGLSSLTDPIMPRYSKLKSRSQAGL
jgi:hypothetical protein